MDYIKKELSMLKDNNLNIKLSDNKGNSTKNLGINTIKECNKIIEYFKKYKENLLAKKYFDNRITF